MKFRKEIDVLHAVFVIPAMFFHSRNVSLNHVYNLIRIFVHSLKRTKNKKTYFLTFIKLPMSCVIVSALNEKIN